MGNSGQTAAEYILVIVVIATVFSVFSKPLSGFVQNFMGGYRKGLQNVVQFSREAKKDYKKHPFTLVGPDTRTSRFLKINR